MNSKIFLLVDLIGIWCSQTLALLLEYSFISILSMIFPNRLLMPLYWFVVHGQYAVKREKVVRLLFFKTVN